MDINNETCKHSSESIFFSAEFSAEMQMTNRKIVRNSRARTVGVLSAHTTYRKIACNSE